MSNSLQSYMRLAIHEAKKSLDDVPVGAYLTGTGHHSAVGIMAHNEVEKRGDKLAHAEYLVVRMAFHTYSIQTLEDFTLYTTLEPCAVCAAVLYRLRLGRLVFGAYDSKAGAVCHGSGLFPLEKTLSGVMEPQCNTLLVNFFKKLR